MYYFRVKIAVYSLFKKVKLLITTPYLLLIKEGDESRGVWRRPNLQFGYSISKEELVQFFFADAVRPDSIGTRRHKFSKSVFVSLLFLIPPCNNLLANEIQTIHFFHSPLYPFFLVQYNPVQSGFTNK